MKVLCYNSSGMKLFSNFNEIALMTFSINRKIFKPIYTHAVPPMCLIGKGLRALSIQNIIYETNLKNMYCVCRPRLQKRSLMPKMASRLMYIVLFYIWIPILYFVAYSIDFSDHDGVIKWKHFPRYWPFVRGINRSPVNFPHKGHWRGALMFSLICTWTDSWPNNGDVDDLIRCHAHYDVIM